MSEKTLKAALISLGSKSSKWTYEAMKKYFAHVDHINIKKIQINLGDKSEILYEGKPLEEYDCIYAKGSFRYADVLGAIRNKMDKKCYMPISAKAFSIGHDKVLSQIQMQKNNVPMPTTYLSSSAKAAKEILKKINYPIIMKLPKGTQGKGVMVADSYASASSMLDTLEALRQPFLIQEFVDTNGEDMRAFVVGNKVIASYKRIASEGESRANIHAGASAVPMELDSEAKKIAIESAKSIGADICAVDMLEGIKSPVVLEVNLSPGLQGITNTTGIDVADLIAKFLHEKSVERKAEKSEETAQDIINNVSVEQINDDDIKEIISNLDLRANKILLPELITKMTRFNETDEVVLKVRKGKLTIEKFQL